MKEKGQYINQRQNGEWTTWHRNGKIKSEGKYHNFKRVGIWTFWYSNGQKAIEEDYTVETPGHEKEYFKHVQYKDGKPVPKLKQITEEDKKEIIKYKETNWHRNGTMRLMGIWNMNNDKIGTWQEWDENGKLITEVTYDKNGEVVDIKVFE